MSMYMTISKRALNMDELSSRVQIMSSLSRTIKTSYILKVILRMGGGKWNYDFRQVFKIPKYETYGIFYFGNTLKNYTKKCGRLNLLLAKPTKDEKFYF